MRMEYSSLACEHCEFLDKIGDDLDIQHITGSRTLSRTYMYTCIRYGREILKSKGTNITLD